MIWVFQARVNWGQEKGEERCMGTLKEYKGESAEEAKAEAISYLAYYFKGLDFDLVIPINSLSPEEIYELGYQEGTGDPQYGDLQLSLARRHQ